MDPTLLGTEVERCSLCGGLPDDLMVNTGRELCFPDAFYQLVPVGIPSPGQGQWVGSQFRRCPDCGAYFDWGDYPQIYGSGNCAEERLTRLSARASCLLNKLFPPNPQAPFAPGDVGEYFDTFPLDMLLRALESHVGTAPNIVTPFVPNLVRLLGKTNNSTIKDLLSNYHSNKPEQAEEILEVFRSTDERGISHLADLLRDCLRSVHKG